jgi:catechol-2,3-dioxygenase
MDIHIPGPVDHTMPPLFERIDHIHIFVSDRAASERWYREVLGFRRVPELEF